MKTKNLLATFAVVLVVLFTGCKKDDFEEIVGVCPIVVSTDPANLATGVPLNKIIRGNFNEKMNSESFKEGTFTLTGDAPVAGTISKADSAIIFTPTSALAPFVTYTGTIKSSVKDFMGNTLRSDYVWTFTTIPQLNLSASPGLGGTVSGAGTYTTGSLVTITATPSVGYSFVSWTDNGVVLSANSDNQQDKSATISTVAAGATYQFTMTGNRTLVANFIITPETYVLNVTANNGTVVKNPDQTSYISGANVLLTATPNAGYTFTSWSGDASGTTNPLVVNMNSNKDVVANFTAIPPTTYTLNVTATNGTVVKTPNQTTYNSGTTVQLTATPNAGYTFTSWSGDGTGSTNPLTVTMNSNKNITANFTAIPPTTYTLNVTATNGTVVKMPNQTTYNSGTTVQLTATPNAGYTFTSWSGDGTGSTNPLTVTMNSNKNITANFTAIPPNTYTLNVISANGTVVKNPSQTSYTSGTTVQLTVTPNAGYTFTSWSGDATGSTNPLTVTMNSNKNITANYTAIPPTTYTLDVIATNGSVLKTPNQTTYNSGTTVALTATPNAGYTFTSWSGDATGSTNPLTVTMNSNKNITANFTAIPPTTYTLNVIATNGSVLKTPNQTTYNSGTTVQLTATPNVGYTFTSWSGDATGSTNPLTVTMNSNKNITAIFTAIPPTTYTLDVTAVNGAVLVNPVQATYTSGANVVLTATPSSGYIFTSWSGDATGTTNPLTVTMNSNKNITANFTAAPSTYTLNVTAVNGVVVKNPNQATYSSATIVQLTANPAVGYVFASWSGDATGTTNPLTVTMNSNKNITANFIAMPSTYTLNVIANNGSVMKNPSQVNYNSGSTVQLTATPNSGYTFTSWSGDASGSINPLNVIMNSNKNITANFTLTPPVGPGPIDLGTAADFTAIGKAGISTTGITSITGDIGVSPVAATYITGFGLIMDVNGQSSHTPIVTGKVYAADYAVPTPSKMTTAVSDMETAFTTANGLTTTVIVDLYAGDISGRILPGGLYKWGTGVLITSAGVTLKGGPNDTWVFQIAQDLTVNNSAIITLEGGAQAKNIFWIVAGEATIGTYADFSGNILSQTLISLNTGATVTGRLLAQTEVTLNASTVIIP